MVFGQVVIGPPGSGKTTYCNGMSQFLSLLGRYVRRLVPCYCFDCPSQAALAKWNALALDLLFTSSYLETGCVIQLVTTKSIIVPSSAKVDREC